METNVGSVDQAVRTVLGALTGIVSLGILTGQIGLPTVVAPVLGVVSIIALFTAATSSCAIYSVLGVRTCPRDAA
ncbi:YgaP family membrane protein [Natronomonas marina]|jgi:hypothetical protein|uniref:YgaP family membrane protein n=1 Tax=Natronomonas marina TaxID=2961939 RepID=UPI0020C93AE0|nr:DUF2892 domain-containing protein [Natronomonas marina]